MTLPQSLSSQMEELKNDWLAQVEADLQHAAQLIETLEQPGTLDMAEKSEDLFRVFHDMKGQAPVFDYALLGSVATKFCTHWREVGASPKPQDLHIARAHLVAARFILEKRLEGCGGSAGPSIMAQLNSIIVKHGSSLDL
jgi:chemotaxis protein histidine kinase CheA